MLRLFRERFIEVTDSPVIIVGECPGRQRKKDDLNEFVFHGNRTGDFIERLVKSKRNIILTNVTNWYDGGDIFKRKAVVKAGVERVEFLVEVYKSRKILLLGAKAGYFLGHLPNTERLAHPSYILRFNKDPQTYFNLLDTYLENRNNRDPQQSLNISKQPLCWLE